jgi:hypothetical protein
MNARRFPSGDHRGVSSDFSPVTSAFAADSPFAATCQMSALRFPDFRSVVVRTNATRDPSGES